MVEGETKIELRGVTPNDEPFLFAVYASTRIEELAPLGWDETQIQTFLRMQFLARERSQPHSDDRIIVLNGRPIGRMLVDRRDNAIRLSDIALLPEYRNAGIGTRLIQDLLDEAAAAGKPVELDVVYSNPAVRLYERLGFRRSDAEKEKEYDMAYLAMRWVPATS